MKFKILCWCHLHKKALYKLSDVTETLFYDDISLVEKFCTSMRYFTLHWDLFLSYQVGNNVSQMLNWNHKNWHQGRLKHDVALFETDWKSPWSSKAMRIQLSEQIAFHAWCAHGDHLEKPWLTMETTDLSGSKLCGHLPLLVVCCCSHWGKAWEEDEINYTSLGT